MQAATRCRAIHHAAIYQQFTLSESIIAAVRQIA